MKMRKTLPGSTPRILTAGLTAMLLAPLGHEAAAQSVSAISIVGVNNMGGYIASLDEQDVPDNSVATASKTQSFTGLDGNGNTQTMTFTGKTVSQSDYGQLHVSTSASVTNSYYNANNAPYADANGSVINTAGSPSTLTTLGFAFFDDTLQYGGALQSGYKARYIFHVDGTNSGTGALADLGVNVDSNPGDSFFAPDIGPTSVDWVTSDYAVNGVTPQKIHVQFSTQAVLNLYDLTDGQNYSGASDFSQTLKLTGIELVNQNGDLASGWTVTSSSGTKYNAIQGTTPAPSSLLVLLGGAVPLAGALRKRRK